MKKQYIEPTYEFCEIDLDGLLTDVITHSQFEVNGNPTFEYPDVNYDDSFEDSDW